METIPLLKKLNEWGVIVDCYLSGWMPLEKRLDPFVRERVKDLVANIYPEGVTYDYEIRDRNYDLLIVTPGPTVNELAHCVAATKQPDTFDWATGTDPRYKALSLLSLCSLFSLSALSLCSLSLFYLLQKTTKYQYGLVWCDDHRLGYTYIRKAKVLYKINGYERRSFHDKSN